MLEVFASPHAWVSLATLTALEIVLGIDNIVFISILAGRLPAEQRRLATRLGLGGALVTRLALLATLSWVIRLSTPLFEIVGHPVTGRDLVLLAGGLFLIAKATVEIYNKVEAVHELPGHPSASGRATLVATIVHIMLLDIVFSLDSVITAVGMVNELAIMVTAVILAIAVMIVFASAVGDFVERHPSIKILALAFLVLIGVLLVAEGTGQHLNKGYIYFAMLFALLVEMLNMRYRKRREQLHRRPA